MSKYIRYNGITYRCLDTTQKEKEEVAKRLLEDWEKAYQEDPQADRTLKKFRVYETFVRQQLNGANLPLGKVGWKPVQRWNYND